MSLSQNIAKWLHFEVLFHLKPKFTFTTAAVSLQFAYFFRARARANPASLVILTCHAVLGSRIQKSWTSVFWSSFPPYAHSLSNINHWYLGMFQAVTAKAKLFAFVAIGENLFSQKIELNNVFITALDNTVHWINKPRERETQAALWSCVVIVTGGGSKLCVGIHGSWRGHVVCGGCRAAVALNVRSFSKARIISCQEHSTGLLLSIKVQNTGPLWNLNGEATNPMHQSFLSVSMLICFRLLCSHTWSESRIMSSRSLTWRSLRAFTTKRYAHHSQARVNLEDELFSQDGTTSCIVVIPENNQIDCVGNLWRQQTMFDLCIWQHVSYPWAVKILTLLQCDQFDLFPPEICPRWLETC